MYSNASLVRDLTPLITTEVLDDAGIRDFIISADAKLNLHLGRRYIVPVVMEDQYLLSGTISMSANSTTITGTSTDFTDEVLVDDFIYPIKTREVMKVSNVSSTTVTVSADSINGFTGSTYFILPPEIVTASRYYAAKLIVQTHFSEKDYNQETSTFDKTYKAVAMGIVNTICANSVASMNKKPNLVPMSDYYNDKLKAQLTSRNNARLVYINNTNASRTRNDEHDVCLSSGDFYL